MPVTPEEVERMSPSELIERFHLVIRDYHLLEMARDKSKELEAIKERLETYSQNLYTTYTAESRKPPNGYVHAIPWFLIENKLQWVLTGVDHIQDVESGKDERSDSRIQDEVKSDE